MRLDCAKRYPSPHPLDQGLNTAPAIRHVSE